MLVCSERFHCFCLQWTSLLTFILLDLIFIRFLHLLCQTVRVCNSQAANTHSLNTLRLVWIPTVATQVIKGHAASSLDLVRPPADPVFTSLACRSTIRVIIESRQASLLVGPSTSLCRKIIQSLHENSSCFMTISLSLEYTDNK